MATLTTVVREEVKGIEQPHAGRYAFSRVLSPVLLSPSLLAILIFAYGYMGFTLWVSMSNWRTSVRDLSINCPAWRVYSDLNYAMCGKGPGFATDVPGIYVFDKMFGAQQYNLGAAASIVMLVLVSLVIVPYLARQVKDL